MFCINNTIYLTYKDLAGVKCSKALPCSHKSYQWRWGTSTARYKVLHVGKCCVNSLIIPLLTNALKKTVDPVHGIDWEQVRS